MGTAPEAKATAEQPERPAGNEEIFADVRKLLQKEGPPEIAQSPPETGRMVRIAMELRVEVPALDQEMSVGDLEVRVGLSTGNATVATGARNEREVAGDHVNAAPSVQSAGAVGSARTRGAAKRSTDAATSSMRTASTRARGWSQISRDPLHRGILVADIEGFGRRDRTDPLRVRLRERLYELLDDALAAAEIPTEKLELLGDGLLVLACPHVSVARLLHPLIPRLATQLAIQNQEATDAERLRLRVAIHEGHVLADAYGYTGAALIHAFRLLDAEAVRTTLRNVPTVDVVVVVSEFVRQSIVAHEYPGIDPADFQQVWVHTKETRTRAWVHLAGPG